MASALSVNSSMSVRLLPSSFCRGRVSITQPRPFNLLPALQSCPRSTVAFSRRRNHPTATTSSVKKKGVKKEKKGLMEEDDFEGDPFEALLNQLEEDLKNDNSDMEDDDDEADEIKEEDVDRLANELAEALGDFDFEAFTSTPDEAEDDDEDDGDDGHEEEERPVKLKNWQLRRLATALKVGRRKTSIKSLAAELCLDRAVVLELLREPPPELLMMSATLPDEPVRREPEPVPETKHIETEAFETSIASVKHEPKVKEPVHVMQQRWSAQKRLKKVQVETLEKVYRRSKRPTNTMISSIVQVTNLPRKRVIKWFEDKRNKDGVPEHRLPYRRHVSETDFSD